MKKEFTIYKKGVTIKPVTILSKEGQPFNRNEKIAKYQYLGYRVGVIDNSFQEVDLSGFLTENPDLIKNLREKYGI